MTEVGLEIGGGNRPFRRDFEQFDAVDCSAETGLAYTLGNARCLPYEDGVFDHVYAANILEHFPAADTTEVLGEWARVLKPGGILELVVPDAMGILHHFFSGQDKWSECAVRLRGTDGLNRHQAAFTLSEFPTVIEQVSTLVVKWCDTWAEHAGIHALAVRVPWHP